MRSARAHLPKPRKTIRDGGTAMPGTLLEIRVVIGVRGSAAAEDSQLAVAVVLERVPGAGGNEDRVSRADDLRCAVDLHAAGALQHEIDFLGDAVVVPLRRLRGLERGLGETLHLRVVQLPDRRAVLRREGRGSVDRGDLHSAAASASATRSCAPRSSAVKNGSASVREL